MQRYKHWLSSQDIRKRIQKSNDFAKALVCLVGCCCEVLSHTGRRYSLFVNILQVSFSLDQRVQSSQKIGYFLHRHEPQMTLDVKLLHKGEDLFIVCKPESVPVSPTKATRGIFDQDAAFAHEVSRPSKCSKGKT
ncbi:hypothetical protein L2E82_11288 [Cichorium intybus]|uniref:Uncharacterized protein n=1 Tax=Cichorium intybus TaxID=13427 RepID=A0ACB9GCW2_CICIN|nr:hypothetical protein L2E82_11288 [Cichorium intybus]